MYFIFYYIYKFIKIDIMFIVKRRYKFLSSIELLNINNIILFTGV